MSPTEDGKLTNNNREASEAPFFLGQDGTLNTGIPMATTHLKIAKLFKTTGTSSVETRIDE